MKWMCRLTHLQLLLSVSTQVLKWWTHLCPPQCSLVPSTSQVSSSMFRQIVGLSHMLTLLFFSAFRYISSMVRWLRPFVLIIASLRLLPLNPFDFGLFNCDWTVWLGLFVLAIAGLQFGILELSPGRLMLGMSPGALHSSFLTSGSFLVNVSHGVLSLAIEGIGTQCRMSPASSMGMVLLLPRLIRCGGHSMRYKLNRFRSWHMCADALESMIQSL